MRRFITHVREKTVDLRKFNAVELLNVSSFLILRQFEEEPFVQYLNNVISQGIYPAYQFGQLITMYNI